LGPLTNQFLKIVVLVVGGNALFSENFHFAPPNMTLSNQCILCLLQ